MTTPHTVAVVGGGQAGLAAARALSRAGLTPLILEASGRAAGSWPNYYDSLTVFSPARYSAMPGLEMQAEPDSYPGRDQVASYLEDYARRLDVEIRFNSRVRGVHPAGRQFVVSMDDGNEVIVGGVVAASGTYGAPYVPEIPGLSDFNGEVLHSSAYRQPGAFVGKKVVVVGGGNSAVQIAYELAISTDVQLASNSPIVFVPQVSRGHDLHHLSTTLGFDDLPLAWVLPSVRGTLVLGNGLYEKAIESGQLPRRPMFAVVDRDGVIWSDGQRESVDVLLFATGYRPDLPYLAGLGALDNSGSPIHVGGISTTHPGLAFVGLEFQRSFASNTLRGVGRDAEHVSGPMAGWAKDSARAIGL